MQTIVNQAYQVLEQAVVHLRGEPVGTIASHDPAAPAPNYAEVFVRDFVPVGLVYLLDGRPEIVRNFLALVLDIRDQLETPDGHKTLPGVMPASFKMVERDGVEEVHADFGNRAIGRVAPVDSMMWWLILLRAYRRISGDDPFVARPEVQRGIRMILNLCLRDRYEVFPTLLVPDGAFMIDRRMGVYGHPLEIQALFHSALNAALELLALGDEEHGALRAMVAARRDELESYVRSYYWLDLARLNQIHRYPTEVFGEEDNRNALNIHPESIPEWLLEWLPNEGGYMVGNVGPGRIDFRFFAQGNLLAALSGLMSTEHSRHLFNLYQARWDDLIGEMPVKILYPAMEGEEWRLMTGCDPKNTPWSYHNGGNWPTILWPFVAAASVHGRRDLAQKALDQAAAVLPGEQWPEYYDGIRGRLVGRRANFFQTWSGAALILAKKILDVPEATVRLGLVAADEQG